MPTEDSRRLRPGDLVEVRPPAEILATLDDQGALDGVPFMPEMLQYIGGRFTVSRRVEKICDTIADTGSLRMRDAVYLEDLRCTGSGHGGCQGRLPDLLEGSLASTRSRPNQVGRTLKRAANSSNGQRPALERCEKSKASPKSLALPGDRGTEGDRAA